MQDKLIPKSVSTKQRSRFCIALQQHWWCPCMNKIFLNGTLSNMQSIKSVKSILLEQLTYIKYEFFICRRKFLLDVAISIKVHRFLFVWGYFIVPLENFSFIWRRHHYRWKAANFDLCSALMAIVQWGFFSLPHLLCHGASVYNGHLRGPVTLTHIAERLAIELSLPVFTT